MDEGDRVDNAVDDDDSAGIFCLNCGLRSIWYWYLHNFMTNYKRMIITNVQ